MRKHLLMALLCLAVACVFASSAFAEKVSYIEHGWDEVGQKLTTTTQTVDCTMLTENDSYLSGGWYAAKGTLTYSSALEFSGDVNLILMDGCKVKAEQGIVTNRAHTLKIYAQSEGAKMGSLEAVGNTHAAIGGYDGFDGTVTIHGGIVSASAGSHGAAIGGGKSCAGQVTIYGGIVTASTNSNSNSISAAIGGGSDGAGTVNIYGGTVSAITNYYGAAIGGGYDGAGTVNIWGGVVNARSEYSAAAIGGGSHGTGTVKIYDGTVNASIVDNCSGAAIGGGYMGIGEVTISGGIVDAVSTSYSRSATIGNGDSSTGEGFVTVAGGKVRATSDNDYTLGGTNCRISLGLEKNVDFIYAKRYTGSVTLINDLMNAQNTNNVFIAGHVNNGEIAGKMLVSRNSVPKKFWSGNADFILPDELTTVGANAFAGITAKTVLVPAKVESVGNNAFANSGVMKIRFLGEDTKINASAFSGCSMLFAFAPNNSPTLNRLKTIPNVVAIPLDGK